MRTDKDIHLTLFQVFQQRGGLFSSTGTGKIIHPDRHILQSALEGTVMLIGQHRGRHHHSHLFAVDSSFESCTYCHLCLTKAHITTNQSVHRLLHLHVSLYVLCSLELIGGILIEERSLEFML